MSSRSGNSCGCGCNNNSCGNYGTLSYLARRRSVIGCNGQSIYYNGPCGCASSACSGVCYPWQDCSCGCDNCIQSPWNCSNGCGSCWNNWNNWGNWNNWNNWGNWNNWNNWNGCAASFTGRCGCDSSGNGITLGFNRGSSQDFDIWNNSVRFRWSGRYIASFNTNGNCGCDGSMALALNGNVMGASRSAGGFGQAVFEANSGDCLSIVPMDGYGFDSSTGVTLIIYRIG